MDDRYEFAMYYDDQEYVVQLSYRAMNIITNKAEKLARRDELDKEETSTISFRWFGTGREFKLSLTSQAEIMDLIRYHTATEDELEAEADEAR